jgi:hypothetical protein
MTTVDDIIRTALVEIGADGLCNPDEECGCGIEDLAPCDCINLAVCVPAKWTIPKEDDVEYEDEEYRAGYYMAIE